MTNTGCGNVESSHRTRPSHIPTAIIPSHTYEDDLNLSGPENCLDNGVHLNHRLHGLAEGPNWQAAVGAAVEKVMQQAQTLKGKWHGRRRGATLSEGTGDAETSVD